MQSDTKHYLYKIFENLINKGTLIIIVIIIFNTLTEFSGLNTEVLIDIAANIEINEHIVELVVLLFGGSGITYGLMERSLRKKYIEEYTPTEKQAQLKKNPKRKSSHLNSDGTTRREDQ